MQKITRPSKFVLIPGGGGQPIGPIERLGLWQRFPKATRTHVAIWIVTKLVLLASAAYLIWG